jgi:thiol-disulfide isomerase/thioredoxin
MKKNSKTVIWIVAFAVVLIGAAFAYSRLSTGYRSDESISSGTDNSGGSSETDVAAPDFTVYDADRNPVKLSDFKGTPVVLNFWASWCGWCVQEMPEFSEVYSEKKDEVRFLFIDWTDGKSETIESAQNYMKENGFDLPVYFDTDQDAVSAYGLTGIPATFFIGKEGYLVSGGAGAISKDSLLDGIQAITED